jgi:hypothetical protein
MIASSISSPRSDIGSRAGDDSVVDMRAAAVFRRADHTGAGVIVLTAHVSRVRRVLRGAGACGSAPLAPVRYAINSP